MWILCNEFDALKHVRAGSHVRSSRCLSQVMQRAMTAEEAQVLDDPDYNSCLCGQDARFIIYSASDKSFVKFW